MSEEEVLLLIRAGGKTQNAGVGHLYTAYASVLMRFFVQRGASGDEAQDVLQDTVIKIVGGIDSWSGEGPARAWIWQIARNCLTDHFRKDVRTRGVEIAVNDESWQRLVETVPSSDGTVRAAQYIKRQGRLVETVPSSDGTAKPQSADECLASGMQTFLTQEPERALALELQMDGSSIAEIALRIGRTDSATKEFLSQCRKKLEPYVAHCQDFLEA
jgi:RNA polymerase sigma-70 factor (ECF subfamily)